MVFFEFDNKSKGEKSKSKQVGLHKTENLLYSKGNRQENEKVVKENTCKSCLKRSQYLKYTENSYYSMEKNPIKKMDRRCKQTFFKDDNKWPTGPWKGAQLVIRKCKLKPQWDITSHLLEYLLSKRQEITSGDINLEKKKSFSALLVGM